MQHRSASRSSRALVTLGLGLALVACSEGSEEPPNAEAEPEVDDSADAEEDQTGDDTEAAASTEEESTTDSEDADEVDNGISEYRCELGDPGKFSAPKPMPLISVGKPVFSSDGVEDADALVDGDYHGSKVAKLGAPSADAPAWIAVDVGEGPSKLLAVWHDPGWSDYTLANPYTPGNYELQVSADSTDGEDGEWETVATVSDSCEAEDCLPSGEVRSRGHSFDFVGMRWLKFVATSTREELDEVRIDELAIHDMSAVEPGEEDTWFFFGDSITKGAFQRDVSEPFMFDAMVNKQLEDYYPALIGGGVGGEHVSDALARLDDAISLNPDFRFFGIAYGTNDAWGNHDPERIGFEDEMRELIERLLAADRVPVLARIPFADAAHSTLPAFNTIIDRLQAEYELPCGPDLYTYFVDNPKFLNDDGVHPIKLGYEGINENWANAAAAFYEASN